MLVGNSFLFLAIPRAASTSFERSCMYSYVPIDYYKDKIANEQFRNRIIPKLHIHRKLFRIRELYGKSYETIAIKRDSIARFISAWKFIIKKVSQVDKSYGEILSNMNFNDFELYWNNHFDTARDLFDKDKCTSFFIEILGADIIANSKYSDIFPILAQTFQPESFWHENDANIKWFQFGSSWKELETYVSDMTGKRFEMVMSNHTVSTHSNMKVTDNLLEFYHSKIDVKQKIKRSLI